LNEKIPFYLVVVAVSMLIFGLVIGIAGAGIRGGRQRRDLSECLEQVNRDLLSAISSQREAAERASRLQTELLGITEYARNLEEGTRRLEERAGYLEARAGSLTDHLDGIIYRSVELADGINRASDNLEESRVLLDELGIVLFGLQGGGGRQN